MRDKIPMLDLYGWYMGDKKTVSVDFLANFKK